MTGDRKSMTQEKMTAINIWVQHIRKDDLEVQDQLAIAGITMRMLEEVGQFTTNILPGRAKKA